MNTAAVTQTFLDRLDGLAADASRIAVQAWEAEPPDLATWYVAATVTTELTAARQAIARATDA